MFDKRNRTIASKKRRKGTNEEILAKIDRASGDAESEIQIPCEHLGIGALVKFDVVSVTDKE